MVLNFFEHNDKKISFLQTSLSGGIARFLATARLYRL